MFWSLAAESFECDDFGITSKAKFRIEGRPIRAFGLMKFPWGSGFADER